MEVFYNPSLKSLVYFGASSSPEHWDEHWKKLGQLRHNPFVLKHTREYLPKTGTRILEAGCGNGEKVMTLCKAGYLAEGVDWAHATVKRLQETHPELPIKQGDIRALPYPNACMDAYWSLGVIEHFPEGFELPLQEAARVLKPGGIALVTVPSMSWLRKLKVRLNSYQLISDTQRSDFFQYVYDPAIVIDGFNRHGLKLINTECLDGVKGFKDEVKSCAWFMGPLYRSQSLPVKVLRRLLQLALSPFAGHIRLYIFRKMS